MLFNNHIADESEEFFAQAHGRFARGTFRPMLGHSPNEGWAYRPCRMKTKGMKCYHNSLFIGNTPGSLSITRAYQHQHMKTLNTGLLVYLH